MSHKTAFWGETAPVTNGGVVAIGNFDGMHLGHHAVLHAAHVRAEHESLSVAALTFDPHPYEVFDENYEPFLLTTTADKVALLEEAGAQEVAIMPFTRQFAALTPQGFVEEILVKGFAPKHVVVGFDFVFGARRAGDKTVLRDLLAPHGIDVLDVPPWHDTVGESVSSTRIRQALRRGDPLLARQLLGRHFSMTGTVIHGKQLGREMGFPTANISLGDYVHPLFGVYAGKAHRKGDDKIWPAVINVGNRPTVDGAHELIEAHILGFDQDIYDQDWSVELWGFLRPEQKFTSIEQLKEQISCDIAQAQHFIAK